MPGIYINAGPQRASTRITTATTTVISATKKVQLGKLIIGTTAAGTILIQNGAGTTLVAFKASMPEGSYDLDGITVQGAQIVTGGASDITVSYTLLN